MATCDRKTYPNWSCSDQTGRNTEVDRKDVERGEDREERGCSLALSLTVTDICCRHCRMIFSVPKINRCKPYWGRWKTTPDITDIDRVEPHTMSFIARFLNNYSLRHSSRKDVSFLGRYIFGKVR